MFFNDQNIWNKDGTSGEFTGIKGGSGNTKNFYAGADDNEGTNAKFYAQADGKIYSDGIRDVLYKKSAVAGYGFGDNLSASGPSIDEWKTTVNSSSDNSNTKIERKLQIQFQKKFSLDTLHLKGYLNFSRSSDGSGVAGHGKVTINILGESPTNSYQTSISGANAFDISLDIGSFLNNNNLFYAEVILEAFVDGLDSSATSNVATAKLNDNIDFFITT